VTQFSDLGISSSFLLKPLATFEISYLLKSWKLDYACHSDQSTMFVGHWGMLLFPFLISGILVIEGTILLSGQPYLV
jgi:hypothetical protein